MDNVYEVMQEVSVVELVVDVCAGISLSAACGFRVFLPLLAVSIAAHFFGFKVNADFEWIGSWVSVVVTIVLCILGSLAKRIASRDRPRRSMSLFESHSGAKR